MSFIDIVYMNRRKYGKSCSGDTFVSRRTNGGLRSCAVLADGLGSGLQANAASSLTATMALEYIAADVDIRRAAEMIMDALPLCPERHIPYSTFTMIRADDDGGVRLIEFGNPPTLLFRGDKCIPLERQKFALPRWNGREMTYSTFHANLHDRIIFCSDGVTQSGLGTDSFPFGWGSDRVRGFIATTIDEDGADIPAASLARKVVDAALAFDSAIAGDDITCAVMHYRDTRVLQVLTGPPFSKDSDEAFAEQVLNIGTTSVVCGGTTAEIVARVLKRKMTMSLDTIDPEIPATSMMDGVALVTEGCITLSAVADLLERDELISLRENGATKLRDLMLANDKISFLVGTGINPANHDPSLPVELEFRRTLVRRLQNILVNKYFKQVEITYF